MLVLSRKVGEQILLPECEVTIEVLRVSGRKVRIGVSAPPEIAVHRKETWHRIRESGRRQVEGCANGSAGIPVLIVEPDEDLAISYDAFLGRRGFEVFTATDGLACVSRLRKSPLDMVVLEPNVLWGGGAGIVALMRDDPSLPLVPVLVHSRDGDIGVMGEAGFPVVDHAVKPLDPQRLAKRIYDVVSRFRQQIRQRFLHRVSPELAGRVARAIDERTGGRFRFLVVRAEDEQLCVQGYASSYHAQQLAQAAVMELLTDSESILSGDVIFDVEVAAAPR